MTPVSQEKKNWYGLKMGIPIWASEWINEHVKKDQIIRKPDPKTTHITLIYGNKVSEYNEIHELVSKQKITTEDYQFTTIEFVQPKHTLKSGEAYWVLKIDSPKLLKLKRELETQYLGNPSDIQLHLTLATVRRIDALEENLGNFSFLIRLRET